MDRPRVAGARLGMSQGSMGRLVPDASHSVHVSTPSVWTLRGQHGLRLHVLDFLTLPSRRTLLVFSCFEFTQQKGVDVRNGSLTRGWANAQVAAFTRAGAPSGTHICTRVALGSCTV